MSDVSRAPASIGVIGTTLAHGLFVAALVLVAHRSPEPPTIAYAVNLVAAPAPSESGSKIPVVAPPKPQPEKTVVTKPTKTKKPVPKKAEPKKPAPTEAKVAPKSAPQKSTTTPLPGETPGVGNDVLTKSFPGLDFPDKEYLKNIMDQIYARFAQGNWAPGLETTIGFTIHRDGSVTDIVDLKKSRDYQFNLAAKGAIRATADANVFGPLPKIWPGDELPISFSFTPRKP